MTREGKAGFSLLEVLVVLALLAVMASLTMMSFGSGDRAGRPETEARLLANRLSLASDEALLTEAELSLEIDVSGYGVDVRSNDGDAWTAHPDRLLGPRHAVAEGIVMTVEPALGRFPIRPGAIGGAAAITFSGSDDSWTVVDDGLTARAVRAAPR